jgi:hypothetical protein
LAQPPIKHSAHPLARAGAASPYGEAVLVAAVSLFGDEIESTAVATAWMTVTALTTSLLAETHKEQVRRRCYLLDALSVTHVRRWGGRLTARTGARDLRCCYAPVPCGPASTGGNGFVLPDRYSRPSRALLAMDTRRTRSHCFPRVDPSTPRRVAHDQRWETRCFGYGGVEKHIGQL